MSIHDGHRGRMKQEFLARPESFPDHKVLETLLFFANPRGDTNPVAHALMERFGSFAGVLDALPDELLKVPGVGEHTVALLKVVKETNRRYLSGRTTMEEIITCSHDAYQVLRPYFLYARNERVAVLCMDGKNKCLGVRVVTEGTINAVDGTARKVAEAALALNASRVVLAHNHPSGIAVPSPADIATTKSMAKTLRSLDIALYDHLVLTDEDMVSFRDSGYDLSGQEQKNE